ncbi:MAG TPA: substrate-binding domain-containing protein, partial [Candidatus Blautia avistercoris]|nr:substrate-binding domain-containing protein [Candidatus Blautia avistercoris]
VELLKKYPDVDGVVAANDMVAISLYKVLTKKGYRVPQDVQIIGFDNINLSWLFTPELTTVAQPIKEMGKTAARIIIQNVEGKKVKKEHIFQVKLVERDTTVLRTYE